MFAAFILLHGSTWTLLPIVFDRAGPIDLMTGLMWGREWQLGYFRHPPLQAWLLESAAWLSGWHLWGCFVLSQIIVATSFWAVWRLARCIVSPLGALVSVLLLEGVIWFNFTSPEFNPNVVELPFWALATWFFHRALRHGKNLDWGLVGMWLAIAAYGKYVAAMLAIAMIGFMIVEPRARRSWSTPGPYVCAAVCVALLAPHLWWMVRQNFPTIHYAVGETVPAATALEWVIFPLGFVGAQLAAMAPIGLLVAVLRRRGAAEQPIPLAGSATSFDRRFVAAMALGPFLVAFAISALSGLEFKSPWGSPMWCFIGLFTVLFLAPATSPGGLRRFLGAWVGVFLIVAGAYVGSTVGVPYLLQTGWSGWPGFLSKHFLFRLELSHFPAETLARRITEFWRAETGSRLTYLIGKNRVAGNIAFHSIDRPSVLINADPLDSPWIDMADLRERGAVVVWDQDHGGAEMEARVKQLFPEVVMQPPLRPAWDTGAKVPPLRIAWGLIYPKRRSLAAN